jgi:protein-glutamine gamma-glutamyltransferase
VAGAINRMNPALATQVRAAWERVNNRWNQWVLNYSRGQQLDMLKALGFESPSWQDLASSLILLLCSAALAGAGWAWWDRRRQDPWQRLQQRVAERLALRGVSVAPHHPPRARAALVRAALGAAGEPLAQSLETLDRERYDHGRVDLRAWWRAFKSRSVLNKS